ncbi:hypothetical protein ID866_760 [Astraeus odoratus]|nr:hypothetical protein ID866_760 [Astraeus odoratus]
MEQDDGLHRAIGARLFALLINLTHITEFDASMFTASVTARLHSSASQVISRLMTSLPKTTSVLTFQITLCQKYLSGPSVGPSSGVRRRKPQARARRGSGVELGTALSSKASSLPVSVTKLAVIPCDEILALVESQRDTSLPTFAMKYALLVAYALLQKQAIPAQKDLSWKNAQQDGRLEHIISSGFPDHGEGSELKKPLLVICGLWPPK